MRPKQQNSPICHGVADGSFLPHKDTCKKFFRCLGGIKHEFTCQGTLEFNQLTSSCDWPQDAKCSIKSQPTTPKPIIHKPVRQVTRKTVAPSQPKPNWQNPSMTDFPPAPPSDLRMQTVQQLERQLNQPLVSLGPQQQITNLWDNSRSPAQTQQLWNPAQTVDPNPWDIANRAMVQGNIPSPVTQPVDPFQVSQQPVLFQETQLPDPFQNSQQPDPFQGSQQPVPSQGSEQPEPSRDSGLPNRPPNMLNDVTVPAQTGGTSNTNAGQADTNLAPVTALELAQLFEGASQLLNSEY